jgi:hypothetical protein
MKARIGATSFFHAGTAQTQFISGSGSNSSPYPLAFMVKTKENLVKFFDLYRPKGGGQSQNQSLVIFHAGAAPT